MIVNFYRLSDALKPEDGVNDELHHEIKGDDVAVLPDRRKRGAAGLAEEIRQRISVDA